jgi:hypothetical protein
MFNESRWLRHLLPVSIASVDHPAGPIPASPTHMIVPRKKPVNEASYVSFTMSYNWAGHPLVPIGAIDNPANSLP